ncbi:MAG TPA: GlsB/YeaQ/YmgE family stress response membrane protein [Pirellulales bacterium]|nr:GlsB/YeaQ/YmgE family stress response membrane protein [Pirellulales bacterium]
MGIVAWLVLGLIAGFIASRLVNKQGAGMSMDIVLGIVGAVVGGFIAQFAGFAGVTGFDLYSLLIAVGGAMVVLIAYHALTRRTAS